MANSENWPCLLGNWRKVWCYSSLDHNNEGVKKAQRNRKLICQTRMKRQMHAMWYQPFPRPLCGQASPEVEKRKHSRWSHQAVYLIRAQKENLHSLDYDLAQWTGSYWTCLLKWRPIWHSMTCHGDDLIACWWDGRLPFIQRLCYVRLNGIPYKLAI